MNGTKVSSIKMLHCHYKECCARIESGDGREYMESIFENQASIVLETRGCVDSEGTITAENCIPGIESENICNRALVLYVQV